MQLKCCLCVITALLSVAVMNDAPKHILCHAMTVSVNEKPTNENKFVGATIYLLFSNIRMDALDFVLVCPLYLFYTFNYRTLVLPAHMVTIGYRGKCERGRMVFLECCNVERTSFMARLRILMTLHALYTQQRHLLIRKVVYYLELKVKHLGCKYPTGNTISH